MRVFTWAVMAFFISINANAALNADHQKIANMMLSGDLSQLKMAAKQIYSEQISEPQLIDIAAEILLNQYPYAARSEIDTLAWLARAIGETENGRYYDTLAEVRKRTKNRKLKKYADSALDNLPEAEGKQYVFGMYELPNDAWKRESKSEMILRIKQQMLAGDLTNLKQAAKDIVSTGTKSQALNDIAAEILLTHYAKAENHQIDTLAWLTNAIGSTGMARYRNALKEVEEKSDSRKLRKYAEKNKEELSSEHAEQYQKGMYDEPLASYDS